MSSKRKRYSVQGVGVAGCFCLVCVLCSGPGSLVTMDKRLLAEADSLFHAGQYEFAKQKYTHIRNNYPNSPSAIRAQYSLGYINVYYDNWNASWEAARREFTLFTRLYPENERIELVNCWLGILTSLESYEQQYEIIEDRLGRLEEVREEVTSVRSTLQQDLEECRHSRDSLISEMNYHSRKVKELEEFILQLQ